MVRNMRETLADATKAGDVASMSRIIRRGGAQIDALTTVRGYDIPISPLMLAVMQGNAQCMDLLIGAGADVNQRCGCHDETALHVCCAQGKAELARLLINAGADLGPADALGRSPLLMSCLCDAPACAELMIGAGADLEQAMTRHNPGATPLYAAALNGSSRCVSLLCEAGVTVDAKTDDGASPMMVGCQQGHLEVAMLLSSYGAARQTGLFRGFLPVRTWAEDLAQRSGNDVLIRWLQESARFTTPLHHIEVLTPERTLSLLRTGHFSPVAGGSESAVERARKYPTNPSADLIVRAAGPWSPTHHELWGRKQREFAVELLKIGYEMRAKYCSGAVLDVWIAHVMPQAVQWEAELPDM